MKLKKCFFGVLIIFFFLGCASINQKIRKVLPDTGAEKHLRNTSQFEKMPIFPKKEPENRLSIFEEDNPVTPAVNKSESGEKKSIFLKEDPNHSQEKRYFVSMIDSDLKSVLLSFAKGSPYNIILDPNVNGRLTMDLKQVTLEEALDNILIPLGYEYKKEGNVIHISMPKKETKIFTLNYLATIREGESVIEGKTPGGVSGDNAESAKVTAKDKADLWEEIEKGLEHLLSEEGKFFLNKMASVIIVTDYSKNLKKVAEFLEIVEGTIQRQVLIEATIVEVMLSDDYQMGLDWTYLVGSQTSTRFLGDNTKFALDTTGLLSTSVFEFSFQYKDIEALLKAISEQGQMNIISRPRLTTLNNQKAIIKVGTEEVYFERETETSTTGKTEIFTPKFFTVGLLLDVTPQISSGDEITLHIHPVISEKIDEKPYPLGGGTIPIVNIRESSSVVKVKSGQTVVLTGLMLEKDIRKLSGVPGLMNIPLLGNIFRFNNNEKIKTELVITLTPRILFGQEMHEYSDDILKNIWNSKAFDPRREIRNKTAIPPLSKGSYRGRRDIY